MSRKHKQRRAIRREVAIEVRRQMAQLKRELVSAQIHSQPATIEVYRVDRNGWISPPNTSGIQ